jgi:hypothetical protein
MAVQEFWGPAAGDVDKINIKFNDAVRNTKILLLISMN